MTSQTDKAKAFAALHTTGTFIIPNFWDIGSAVMLERSGFSALASTSAGYAQAIGCLDSQITLEQKLAHLQDVSAATTIPINADFEHGFADKPEDVAANLLRAAEAGVVGASIEDWSRTQTYDFNQAVERIQACSEAVKTLDFPFTLTARAENLLRGTNDFDDTVQRLIAYEKAGADVLYAPGLQNEEQIETVLASVTKPINVLFVFMPDKSVADYAKMGVRRISLGSALANVAIGATLGAIDAMLGKSQGGEFDWVRSAASGKVITQLLE